MENSHSESLLEVSALAPGTSNFSLAFKEKKKKKLEKREGFLITIGAYPVQRMAACGSAAYSFSPGPRESSLPDSPTDQRDPLVLHSSPPPEQSPWVLGGPPQLG